jgi:hypothetical protein
VRAVNAALSRMTGRPLAELPGAPVHTLMHPTCHPRLLQVLRAARCGAASGVADLCLRRVDGSAVELATSWSVLSDASGDATQLVFVAADAPVQVDFAPVHVAASIGVAVARVEQELAATDVLRQADTAVHAAKSAGGGRVQTVDRAVGEAVEHRYALPADLRTALVTDSPDLTAHGSSATGPWKRDVSVPHGLKRLLELHQIGASVAAIAAALNDEGFRTPAGLPWHRSSVARVLAHQIRRCGGTPDPGAGARRLARAEGASPPPS